MASTHTVLMVSNETFSITSKVIQDINTLSLSECVSQRMQRKPGEQVWTEVAQPPAILSEHFTIRIF